MLRKPFFLLTVLSILLILSSCKDEFVTETTDAFVQFETTTQSSQTQESVTNSETATEVQTTEVQSTAAPETTTAESITVTETTTQEVDTTVPVTEVPPATEVQITEAATENAASWDVGKVVEFYKNAAEKTGTEVKSQQTVALKDISVNNGQLSGMFSFVTPILSSFLSSNVTETDGITGDFSLLGTADVSSAKAYETADGTVVEITLNEQTDSAASSTKDGSVSHGITVVGDLPSIMSQLREKGLPIDISVENTVMTYTNPVIKVLVDKDGKIVKGTWSCTVEISLSDYKFAGAAVDSTSVVLNNKIIVNGGLS